MYNVVFRKSGMDKISAMPTVGENITSSSVNERKVHEVAGKLLHDVVPLLPLLICLLATPSPYCAGQASNFVAWVVYAIVFGDPNLLRVNVIGCGFSALYFTIFAFWSTGNNRRQFFMLLAAFLGVMGAIFCGVLLSGASHDTQVSILGYIAMLCNVIMYVFPLAAIRMALKTMDPAAIPLLLTLAGTACSALWLLYGLLTNNWFVAGPNVAGVGLNIVQLGLIGYINVKAGSSGPRKSISSDDDDVGDAEYDRMLMSDDPLTA